MHYYIDGRATQEVISEGDTAEDVEADNIFAKLSSHKLSDNGTYVHVRMCIRSCTQLRRSFYCTCTHVHACILYIIFECYIY